VEKLSLTLYYRVKRLFVSSEREGEKQEKVVESSFLPTKSVKAIIDLPTLTIV
jgi:hypothetical protein